MTVNMYLTMRWLYRVGRTMASWSESELEDNYNKEVWYVNDKAWPVIRTTFYPSMDEEYDVVVLFDDEDREHTYELITLEDRKLGKIWVTKAITEIGKQRLISAGWEKIPQNILSKVLSDIPAM